MFKPLKHTFFIALSLLLAAPSQAQSPAMSHAQNLCVKDSCFPPHRTIGETNVPLRGSGRYKFLMFNFCTGVFYAPPGYKTIDSLLDDDVPKSLTIEYHRNISKKIFTKVAEKTIRKNPNNNVEDLEERIRKVHDIYKDVKKGDRYELVYTPGKGTDLYYNDEKLITVPGADFARAYMGIWISDYPATSKKFRDKLIGKRK